MVYRKAKVTVSMGRLTFENKREGWIRIVKLCGNYPDEKYITSYVGTRYAQKIGPKITVLTALLRLYRRESKTW